MPPESEGARARAVQVLLRIDVGGAYTGKVRQSSQGAAFARQVTDLVGGVMRWRRYLDFLLAAQYTGAFARVEPRLKQILRIAAYECHIAGKPAYAAVSSAVQLAKSMVRPGAGRLVNAVLRGLQRAEPLVPDTGDVANDLGIRYSHPTWMVARWLERLDLPATRALLMHNNERPWYGLRCNTLRGSPQALQARLTALGVRWKPPAYLDDFVRVARIGGIGRAGLLDDGWCAVQDEGAGLVVRLLNPQPGDYVLDLCAAPGGKATYAATRMQDRGSLLAVDLHEGRLRQVASAARSQQLSSIKTCVADARILEAAPAMRVLVDVPCTGTGVLGKRADLRWRRSPEDLERLTDIQDQLMDAAARCVRPGGIMVYSTCSIEPEENGMRVKAFLGRHEAFAVEHAGRYLPGGVVTGDGYLQTLPPGHAADGAFAARMRRRT